MIRRSQLLNQAEKFKQTTRAPNNNDYSLLPSISNLSTHTNLDSMFNVVDPECDIVSEDLRQREKLKQFTSEPKKVNEVLKYVGDDSLTHIMCKSLSSNNANDSPANSITKKRKLGFESEDTSRFFKITSSESLKKKDEETIVSTNHKQSSNISTSTSNVRQNEMINNHLIGHLEEIKVSLNEIRLIQSGILGEIKSQGKEIQSIKTAMACKESLFLSENNYATSFYDLGRQYSIDLPVVTMNDFNLFEYKLKTSSDFYNNVKLLLESCIDSLLGISKFMTNLLKNICSKEVASQFVAKKQVKNKIVFKDTQLYLISEGVIKQRRISSNLTVTEKEFNTALSSIFSNVTAWKTKIIISNSTRPNDISKAHENSCSTESTIQAAVEETGVSNNTSPKNISTMHENFFTAEDTIQVVAVERDEDDDDDLVGEYEYYPLVGNMN